MFAVCAGAETKVSKRRGSKNSKMRDGYGEGLKQGMGGASERVEELGKRVHLLLK